MDNVQTLHLPPNSKEIFIGWNISLLLEQSVFIVSRVLYDVVAAIPQRADMKRLVDEYSGGKRLIYFDRVRELDFVVIRTSSRYVGTDRAPKITDNEKSEYFHHFIGL